jgi:hypothetical protein
VAWAIKGDAVKTFGSPLVWMRGLKRGSATCAEKPMSVFAPEPSRKSRFEAPTSSALAQHVGQTAEGTSDPFSSH